ncbi:U-scoloptoxin(05)-Cw1a-like [Dreissena polymorpha]|uniref:Protein sleepless n=1 Tax=Dreissena polymorpha TaxID=45954 RepID=A0A9D4FN45_DREPO|nr:U-scoloptoxin(05)-Cw1a-like [Dreissena polymorpha]KAH3802269.1 hypothetical protein DPMN_155942 [Dreissena polymorpha]
MVGTNTFVLAGVLAVLLCVSRVDAAFKCYQCIGTSDSDSCSDEFEKSSSLESSSNCNACTKSKTNGIVTRACSPISLGGNKCEESNGVEQCICESELCNGSNNLAVSVVTLLAATLAVYFVKF